MTKKLRKEKWRINVCMETTQQSLHFYSNHQTQLSLDLLIESLGASPDGFQSIKGDKSLDWAFFLLLLCCFSVCTNVYVCARTSGLLSQAIHQAIWSLCWLIIMGFWGWPSAKYARVCPHTYLHTLQTLRKDRKANRDTDGKELYREKNTASRKETWTGWQKQREKKKKRKQSVIHQHVSWLVDYKGKRNWKKKLRVDWYIYTACKKMW